MRRGKGVEGADGGGEGVEDVEVCFVAVEDELAEVFFVGGAGGWLVCVSGLL